MEELPNGRNLDNLAPRPLGDIKVAFTIDFHAVGTDPPALGLIPGQNIQEREVRPLAQCAVGVNRKFQDAVTDRFADIEGFLIRRNADPIGIIEVVGDFDPVLPGRREVMTVVGGSTKCPKRVA